MVRRTFRKISHDDDPLSYSLADLHDLDQSTEGLDWNHLLTRNRVLIVSSAGTGKTYECKRQADILMENDKSAFYIDLSQFEVATDISDLLGDKLERFEQWQQASDEFATFFLDSIDELQLTPLKLETAINRFVKWINNQLQRVKIVVTTRPTKDNLQILETRLPFRYLDVRKNFVQTAMGEASKVRERNLTKWLVVKLESLTDNDIKQIAMQTGIKNHKVFLNQVAEGGFQDFLSRPLDVLDLLEDWVTHKQIRGRQQQIETNIERKLEPSQEDRKERSELSASKAMLGASMLAFGMHMTGRYTLIYKPIKENFETKEKSVDPRKLLLEWNPEEIEALLQRPLFEYSSPNRVKFHHRSVAEQLAVKQIIALRSRGMTLSKLESFLFFDLGEKKRVPIPKEEIAARLALSDGNVFDLLCKHQPEVLFSRGYPESLTVEQRQKVLLSYCEILELNEESGVYLSDKISYKFATSDLASVVNEIWNRHPKNIETRLTLLRIIDSAKINDCSDIAYEVLSNSEFGTVEKFAALDALVSVDDPRLEKFTERLLRSKGSWNTEFTVKSICVLFPNYINVEQLSDVLYWMDENRDYDKMYYPLDSLISKTDLGGQNLDPLRDRLVQLISKDVFWCSKERHLVTKRPHLTPLLATLCMKALKQSISNDWLWASVVLIHSFETDISNNKTYNKLLKLLKNMGKADYEKLRLMDFNYVSHIMIELNQFRIEYEIFYRQATMQLDLEHDKSWMFDAIADTSKSLEERKLLVKILLSAHRSELLSLDELLEMKEVVIDSKEITEQIEHSVKQHLAGIDNKPMNKKHLTGQKEKNRKEADAYRSWEKFFDEISNDLNNVFSDNRSNGITYNLWRVMTRDSDDNEITCWNRRLIEIHFDKSTADKLRRHLMQYWRQQQPKLPSERPANERNGFPHSWLIGKTGIYAEAENVDWVNELSYAEVKLAVRYSLVGLNSFQPWITDIATHEFQSKAILDVLGSEVDFELEQPQQNSYLLQEIGYAPIEVGILFVPKLIKWLETLAIDDMVLLANSNIGNCLMRTLKIIENHGNQAQLKRVTDIATNVLETAVDIELGTIMMSVLFKLAPAKGMKFLEKKLKDVSVAQYSQGVKYIANLFGDKLALQKFKILNQNPCVLQSLLNLVFKHVRRKDDIGHDGCYTPNERDDAESARSNILNCFLKSNGERAYKLKQELANDQRFVEQRDYILSTADSVRVEELNAYLQNESEVVEMFNKLEMPPRSNKEMFDLTVSRIEFIRDNLRQDSSLRANWAELPKEFMLRRAIARELENSANSKYSVYQEPVTGEENKRDIALRSMFSDHEAVIELKKAENWTLRQLKTALREQLVGKYLQPRKRRTGILLLTLSTELKPCVKKVLEAENLHGANDLEQLANLLEQEAMDIKDNFNGELYLGVEVLDLRNTYTNT